MHPESSDPRLDIDVLKQLRVIFKSVRRHVLSVEQACGISGSQLWALVKVGELERVSLTQLAQELAIHQSTASNLVERLVDKALVSKERTHNDLRAVSIVLTPAGREVLQRAPLPFQGLLPDALGRMPYAHLRNLHSLLGELLELMSQLEEEDGPHSQADALAPAALASRG